MTLGGYDNILLIYAPEFSNGDTEITFTQGDLANASNCFECLRIAANELPILRIFCKRNECFANAMNIYE